VHFPQVRSIGFHPEVGRPLRVAIKHCQREDLRVPVVLVFVCCRAQRSQFGVPHRRCCHAQVPLVVVESKIPSGSPGRSGDHHQKMPDWRLVCFVPVG